MGTERTILTGQQTGVGQIHFRGTSANTQDRLRGLGCDVAVLAQSIQHGLQGFDIMEAAAHTHGISAGELADLTTLNGVQ